MPFKPALGVSDFRKLREEGAGYVDKTDFIAQLLDESTQVVLFPRPRRFGKTINLSALRYFLEKRPEDLSHLFQDLAVWQRPGARTHFQRHPVGSRGGTGPVAAGGRRRGAGGAARGAAAHDDVVP